MTEYAVRNLAACRANAERMIAQVLEAEINYIFTQEEDYLSEHGALLPPRLPEPKEQRMTDAFVIEVRARVVDYFLLVFRNLRDTVPKIIGQVLINSSAASMQLELFEAINKDQGSITATLSEPDFVVQQRADCRNALKVLKNCLKKLQEEDLLDDQ